MTDRFESILDECISALQAGVSIEEILAEVPEYADELRPMLYAASILADPNPELAPEEKKFALRNEYMRQVTELSALPTPSLYDKTQAALRIIKRRLTRKAVLNDLLTITITSVLTALMALFMLNYLAADTIPGDFLYGVKRISENIQLSLTLDDSRRDQLMTEFNQRRLQEMDQLMEQSRGAMVQFSGILEKKGENLWIVQGYTVFLPPDIEIDNNIQEGDWLEVIGLLRTNNVVVADTIRRGTR